jgi:signal transduction histidine kinase/DNA-binding response OmpR family regulator
MTARHLHTLIVGPDDSASSISAAVSSAASVGGLTALDAIRLGLATSTVVGRVDRPTVVELADTSDEAGARIQATVRGGAGRCDDLPEGLADACSERRVGAGGIERRVSVGGEAATASAIDPVLAGLHRAADCGPAPDQLLGVALATVERLRRLRVHERAETMDLRAELEETSRGLMAVYTESADEAERAVQESRAKAEFLANMSHEIRSPLAAVIGYTGLLLESGLTADQTEYAETIRGAGNHLRGLVDDILDLSKIESGRLDLEDIPFDLVGCVEDAIGIVAASAEEKGLALAALFDPLTPLIAGGDPVRLRQILVNLLTNAVKFTPEGQVTVEVEAIPEPPMCRLRFHVRDTGIGIPPDARDRIFNRFGQADAATTRTFGGTGLGLSICRQLSQLMGGNLTVESEVGVGSTFTCTTVMRLLEPDRDDAILSGRTVLVIHHHHTTAEAISRMVSRWGATVAAATTVDDALVRHRDWSDAALVIVGPTRPGVDVAELARRLMVARPDQRPPVIAVIPLAVRHRVTPSTDDVQAVVCAPVRREQLREAVLAATADTRSPRPTDRAEPGPADASAAIPEPGPSHEHHPPRQILYVDDDPTLTTMVRRILVSRRPNLTVHAADRAVSAMDLIRRTDLDLILLDLHLPDMTGEDLLRLLRADNRTSGLPIVVVSGDTTPDSVHRLAAAGATDYLAKPFTAARLRELVAILIDRPRIPTATG